MCRHAIGKGPYGLALVFIRESKVCRESGRPGRPSCGSGHFIARPIKTLGSCPASISYAVHPGIFRPTAVSQRERRWSRDGARLMEPAYDKNRDFETYDEA